MTNKSCWEFFVGSFVESLKVCWEFCWEFESLLRVSLRVWKFVESAVEILKVWWRYVVSACAFIRLDFGGRMNHLSTIIAFRSAPLSMAIAVKQGRARYETPYHAPPKAFWHVVWCSQTHVHMVNCTRCIRPEPVCTDTASMCNAIVRLCCLSTLNNRTPYPFSPPSLPSFIPSPPPLSNGMAWFIWHHWVIACARSQRRT